MRKSDPATLKRLMEMEPDLTGLDRFSRNQPAVKVATMFPSREGVCSCGCGEPLTGRRTRWATDKCGEDAWRVYAIHCGYSNVVRYWVGIRDRGVCADCGEEKRWEADHVTPVVLGGGGCGLDGYQTLCLECHKAKSRRIAEARAIVRRGTL